MSNTLNPNGSQTQRKTLSAQLDRLDTIIDALDQALPEVVAEAVNKAVSAAVQQTVEAVLREVLNRPELLRVLTPQPPVAAVAQPTPAQPAAPPVSSPSRLRRCCTWLGIKLSSACRCVGQAVACVARPSVAVTTQVAQRTASTAGAVYRRTRQVLGLCLSVLLALAGWLKQRPCAVALSVLVGLAVGLGAYLAGPVVSSAVLGLTGTLVSLVGSALAPLFRLLINWRSPSSSA